jgi:hypothetical protein
MHIFLLPGIGGLFGNPVLPTQIADWGARFDLPEAIRNLFIRILGPLLWVHSFRCGPPKPSSYSIFKVSSFFGKTSILVETKVSDDKRRLISSTIQIRNKIVELPL